MNLGGRRSGPKRSSRAGRKEYQAMRRAQLAALVARKREQERAAAREREGEEGEARDQRLDVGLVHSSDLREEVEDIYADPAYHEGDYVVILGDTRPGINSNFSYDKEGKITQVVDGEGALTLTLTKLERIYAFKI